MSLDKAEIEAMVRQVVARVLGQSHVPQTVPDRQPERRPILDEAGVRQMPAGSAQTLPPGTIVTPLARQIALELGIRLETAATPGPVATSAQPARAKGGRVVALGADHGGYELKEMIKAMLDSDSTYAVVDCGTTNTDSVDYPDYAYAVAQMVAAGQAWRGIIVDGAGIGSCMAANKVPGVLAAMCYDQATAVNSREHNNANVLTLGAGLIGPNLARQIVMTWLGTEFGGGRHARRVAKINQIGDRFRKG